MVTVRGVAVGTVTPVKGKAPAADTTAPTTGQKTDAYAADAQPKLAEVPATAGALAAGDKRLGKSSALLDMILTADKTSFVEKKAKAEGQSATTGIADRDVAKRVGLILQTSPYGAPTAVLVGRMKQDPVIAARFPDLKHQDLVELHTRFPTLVPSPFNPVDMGPSYGPTPEGYLDIFASMFVRDHSRHAALAEHFPGINSANYLKQRFNNGGPFEVRFPELHVIMNQTARLREGMSRTELFLRRAIQHAPPHWSAADIAGEHNRYVEYFAPMLWFGEKDSIAAAKERATVTPEQVMEFMVRNPVGSGANELNQRRTALRETVLDTLRQAKPSDNLYAVLDALAGRLTDADQRPDHRAPNDYGRGYGSSQPAIKRPPGPNTAITAEDLLHYVAGDPGLATELDRLMGDRKSGFDQRLAQNIAKKLGPRLAHTSVSEIVKIMRKEDSVYNEPLVQHLISSFPKIFGGARIETGRVEVNFLLAQQVADAMDKMFVGATLDDVAKFLRSKGSEFTSAFPDFAAEDVRLLQAAFPFLPQWESKAEGAAVAQSERMPLESLVKFAALRLGPKEAKALQATIFKALAEPGSSEKVPPALLAEVEGFFTRGILNIVAGAAKVTGDDMAQSHIHASGSMREDNTGTERELFARFLLADPKTNLDHPTLVRILRNPKLSGMPEAKASVVASALLQAREGDLEGLYETAQQMLSGHPQADTILTQLTNQFLGREALLSRLERDVFANKELRASFQRFARIPLRLPMIQHVVEKYKDAQPLEDTNVLMVQHMLGQAYPQINGYKQLGMDPKQCIFVGIPYHKNEEVEQAVAKSFGVDVRVPPRDMDELYKAIEKGVDDVVAQHKKNGKPVLVVCDGPHARDYFKKKYPELSGVVRFTEQTAFGDRPEYRDDKSMRVVSYARTDLKQKKEAKFIGQAVARAINAVLTQLGTGYEEKPVLILGYGSIGQATAEALGGDRAKIYVYDPYLKPEQEADAKAKGFTVVKDKNTISAGKFMMVGCSGHLSIDQEQIMSSDPNAIYVSASSKLVEIDMRKLKELATDAQGRVRKILAAEVNDQQTWHYWLKDGTIRTVIADGLPANFNDINSVPPEFIDMTMSLSLAAAVQAVSSKDLGYDSLNTKDADELVTLYESMVEKMHAEAREAAAKEAPAPA